MGLLKKIVKALIQRAKVLKEKMKERKNKEDGSDGSFMT